MDFASVGSNDLMQFLFAADRANPRVAGRYDPLSPAPLRALKSLVRAAKKHRVPLTLCGEMAGLRHSEAMALIGLGFRSISMAPASVGPVKSMILSRHARRLQRHLGALLKDGCSDIRGELQRFAEAEAVEIWTVGDGAQARTFDTADRFTIMTPGKGPKPPVWRSRCVGGEPADASTRPPRAVAMRAGRPGAMHPAPAGLRSGTSSRSCATPSA